MSVNQTTAASVTCKNYAVQAKGKKRQKGRKMNLFHADLAIEKDSPQHTILK